MLGVRRPQIRRDVIARDPLLLAFIFDLAERGESRESLPSLTRTFFSPVAVSKYQSSPCSPLSSRCTKETLVPSGLHLTVSGARPVSPPSAKMASMVNCLGGVVDCAESVASRANTTRIRDASFFTFDSGRCRVWPDKYKGKGGFCRGSNALRKSDSSLAPGCSRPQCLLVESLDLGYRSGRSEAAVRRLHSSLDCFNQQLHGVARVGRDRDRRR